jgi:P-type Ca2+ transporter type 2C
MEYRILGGKMPHLELSLMSRLAEGLLHYTAKREGNLLVQRPTQEADLSFSLIGSFLAEVSEFRQAVSSTLPSDLAHYLKIHRRCQPRSTTEQRVACATLLGQLIKLPRFQDWRELVKEEEWDDVEKLMSEYPDKFTATSIPVTSKSLFPPPALYFDKNSERLAEMFESNIKSGLKESQIARLREHYGPNKLPDPPRESVLHMIWKQLTDFMIIILIIVGVTEASTDDRNTAIILFVVVLFNVVVGVTQEYKANQALDALLTLTVPQASVIRDGQQKTIDSADLIPGDLVVLEEGSLL